MKRLLVVLLGTLVLSSSVWAADQLVIISPHRKSIQSEFIPKFEAYYKEKFGTEVKVEWLDQGGTSSAVRYVRGKYATNPEAIGVDVFWGGTSANFVDMAAEGLLEPYALSPEARKNLPAECAGVPLSDSKNRWHATAISSFGIMYNKPLLKMDKLEAPESWDDLAKPGFQNNITIADPRKSGTNSTMMIIVLESQGWTKGWQLLTSIAGNTMRYTHSSSDPVRAVVSGDTTASMVIDFYGLSQIWELGEDKIGFHLPKGQTVLDPDPVAMLYKPKNKLAASRFIEYLLTPEAQKIWLLPKGTPGGPKQNNLARLAVNPSAYEVTEGKRLYFMNPFEQKKFLKLDLERAGKMRRVLNDLVGAVLVDSHKELKKAWARLMKDKVGPEGLAWFGKAPVSEKEVMALSAKWGDDVFRNQTINQWTAEALKKYERVASGEQPWKKTAH